MAQWGKERIVAGGRYVPFVSANPWVAPSDSADVIDVVMLDCGPDLNQAKGIHAALLAEYIGSPYKKWLSGAVGQGAYPIRLAMSAADGL